MRMWRKKIEELLFSRVLCGKWPFTSVFVYVFVLQRAGRHQDGLQPHPSQVELKALQRLHPSLLVCQLCPVFLLLMYTRWWRGTVVERRSLAGELSLSCARPAADG